MEKELKKFDLQRALAGDKFARKSDMKEPDEWHYFEKKSGQWNIICIFSGDCLWFTREGKFDLSQDSEHNLVILPKKKKLYIAVGKKPTESGSHPTTYASTSIDTVLILEANESTIVEIEIDDE